MNIGTARSLSLQAGPAGPEPGDARPGSGAEPPRGHASRGGHDLPGRYRPGAGDRAAVPARAGNAAGRPVHGDDGGVRRARPVARRRVRRAPRASSGARSPPRTCWSSPAGPPRTCSRSPARRRPRPVDGAPRRRLRRPRGRCLVVAAVAAPPTRASLRGLLTENTRGAAQPASTSTPAAATARQSWRAVSAVVAASIRPSPTHTAIVAIERTASCGSCRSRKGSPIACTRAMPTRHAVATERRLASRRLSRAAASSTSSLRAGRAGAWSGSDRAVPMFTGGSPNRTSCCGPRGPGCGSARRRGRRRSGTGGR